MEPIEERPWTLQEILLSTQVLTYGSRNLLCFCRKHALSDGGIERGTLDAIMMTWSKSLSLRMMTNDEEIPYVSNWEQLVSAYTARHLIVPEDKLVALSGIAQRYAHHRSDCPHDREAGNGSPYDYLACLCRSDLHQQLLWTTKFKLISPRRVKEYRAPSWSWASVDGKILFTDMTVETPADTKYAEDPRLPGRDCTSRISIWGH
jgi:hypothetical protein